MRQQQNKTPSSNPKVLVRIHYAVEYTDNRGRRRRQRRDTLQSAEQFRRQLRMGSDAIIRIIARPPVTLGGLKGM